MTKNDFFWYFGVPPNGLLCFLRENPPKNLAWNGYRKLPHNLWLFLEDKVSFGNSEIISSNKHFKKPENFFCNKFLDRLENVSLLQIILCPEVEEWCVLQKEYIFCKKKRINEHTWYFLLATIQICINFGNLFAFWWKKSEEGPKKILAPQVSNFWWPLLLFSWPEDFLACRTLRYFLIPLPKSPFRPNRAKIDWIRDNFWIVAFPSKISWNFWGL